MSLREQIIADADLFTDTDDFGEEITYLPKGDEIGFAVDVQFMEGAAQIGGQMLAVETEGTLLLPKADVAAPCSGDSFVRADGVVWNIDFTSPRGSDAAFWRLSVKRDPIPTFRGF